MQPIYLALVMGILMISLLTDYNRCSAGTFDIPIPPAARTAAENGLKDLRAIRKATDEETEQEAKRLGFVSSEEMERAALDHRPLPILVLTPRHVIDAITSSSLPDLGTFAQQATQFIFPVTAGMGGPVRSSIIVARSGNDESAWDYVQFGAKSLITLLERYTQKTTPGLVLWLPGLSRYFIGLSDERDLQLVPIRNEPGKGFVAGEPISGNDVFRKLRAEAERFIETAQNKRLQLRGDKQIQQGGSK